MRRPLTLLNPLAQLGEVGDAQGTELPLPRAQLLAQLVEQPAEQFRVAVVNDRTAVRQVGQRAQGAVAAVDAVQVQVLRAVRAGQRDG